MVKVKREFYGRLPKCRNRGVYESSYKVAKKEVEKVVWEARFKVYEELYPKLETKDGEKGVYQIARLGETKTRDLAQDECIIDEDQKIFGEGR